MAMNMKATKKMKGFMCHSQSSTAVCMSQQDFQSVVLPRKPRGITMLSDQMKNTRYVRLGDKRAIYASSMKKSLPTVSSIKNDEDNREEKKVAADHNTLALSDHIFQVVVMRVSIHCQGCAGKVKKHLSKMEGVTSINIDLESKRVTVMGYVSPSVVLENISKVKKAEFWPC